MRENRYKTVFTRSPPIFPRWGELTEQGQPDAMRSRRAGASARPNRADYEWEKDLLSQLPDQLLEHWMVRFDSWRAFRPGNRYRWNPGHKVDVRLAGVAGEQFMARTETAILIGQTRDLPEPQPERGRDPNDVVRAHAGKTHEQMQREKGPTAVARP
jgi:hypothetical protein